MRNMFMLGAAVLFCVSVASASTLPCTISTGVDNPVTSGTVIVCGGLTFDNFQVMNPTGGATGTVDILVGSDFDSVTGASNLNFNPNLGANQGEQFLFQVSGGIDQIEMSVGGINATVTELACANPIPTTGALAFTCTDPTGSIQAAPLAQITVSSGTPNQPVSSAFFPTTSPVYIFKSLQTSPNGQLSALTQGFEPASPQAPNLLPTPASMSFGYQLGGAQPGSQALAIASSSAASALSFTAAASTTSGGNWLSVSPLSGTTPAVLMVSVNTAGLAVGSYNGAITVTSGPAGNNPLSVPVTLNVTQAPQQGLVCTASIPVTPMLRHEGFTELTGDILLSCVGAPGAAPTPTGAVIPQANISVSLSAPVTSRILSGTATEALLLVDDPSPANQDPCLSPTNPTVACQVLGGKPPGATFNSPGRFNVFQGIGGGPGSSSVTFLGVPVDPPSLGITAASRTYRITNVRLDATSVPAGAGGLSPVFAFVSSGSPSITINNPQLTVGFASNGLTVRTSAATPPFLQCLTYPTTTVGTVTFAENFATAFKVAGFTGQNTAGTVYNTESGLEIAVTGGTAGVANTGTRLQTTISNIPSGVTIYVDNWAQSPASAGCTAPGINNTGCTLISDATMVTGTGTPVDPGKNTVTAVTNGTESSVTVVWEVTNTNSSAIDSLVFNIYASSTGVPGSPSLATAALSGFSPQFASYSSSGPIPEFSSTVNVPATPSTLFTVSLCPAISGQVTLSGSGLSGVTMALSGSQSAFTATNGSGNYSFTVPGGNYTVTPSLNGYTFNPPGQTFNNLSGNQTANFAAILAAPVITSNSPLPAGTVGVNYSQTLAASGGTPPYIWTVTTGTLPAGLSLNSATISGTPTTAGASNFSIQVSDSQGLIATKSFSLSINAALVITTSSPLPAGTVSAKYAQTLKATGGAVPYTWALSGGSLPAGLSLNPATGAIGGTPTASGAVNFIIQVTDAKRVTATAPFTLTINAALTITNAVLPSCTVGANCSQTVSLNGGTGPYTYVVSAGALPAGLSLNSTSGQISGTPTTSGVSSFTIQVTDSNGATASQQYKLTINPPLTITTTSPLTGGTANISYTLTFQAAGGTPPYTWAVSAGALPAGILLNSATGQVSGKPAAGGTANFTIQITDANGAAASAPFTLTIAANPAITTATLPPPALGSPYSTQLSATGSGAPFTWSISSGSLPGGLTLSTGGLISGTPAAPGTFTFSVLATDASNNTASITYSLTVPQVPLALTIQAPSSTALPQQQLPITLTLPQAYPVDLAGELVLQFTPNQTAPVVDPAIQFSTGGGTVAFQIPAGQTSAVFPQSPLAVQTGTVAGAIVLTANVTAGGVPVTLSNSPGGTVNLPQEPPAILSVVIQQVSSGFNVLVTGYSNTREVTQATFTFTPASGSQLQTGSFPLTNVAATFQSYYTSDASTAFGSQFLYTQPFTITAGSVSALQSVTVTLTNSQGASSAVTVSTGF